MERSKVIDSNPAIAIAVRSSPGLAASGPYTPASPATGGFSPPVGRRRPLVGRDP